MKLRGTFAVLGLLLSVGIAVSAAGAAKPCSRKRLQACITTRCAGLTGRAKVECKKRVRAACEADACTPVAPEAAIDTTVIQCCHTVGKGITMCQVKTRRACQNNDGIDMGPGT